MVLATLGMAESWLYISHIFVVPAEAPRWHRGTDRLSRISTWTPASAGVTVKDFHILSFDIDTIPVDIDTIPKLGRKLITQAMRFPKLASLP